MENATSRPSPPASFKKLSLPASLWGHLPPPLPILQATIIIPAKDEAAGLPATLAALAAQTDERGQPMPAGCFEVLVLANNCTDHTAAVVRTFAAAHPALALHVAEIRLPRAKAHVGQARRLLMDEAARRLEAAGQPCPVIVSTDADTRVAPDWLAATLRELAAGPAAVAGRILMEESPRTCPVRRCQLQDATHQLLRVQLETQLDPQPHDPWPRHHQHFGASLAITVAAYRQVGGLPIVPFLEDEALYQALLRHDLRVRHSPAVRVFTSGRQQGRVAVGLSWQLREWAKLGQQQLLVPDPAVLVEELRLRHALRQHWQQLRTDAAPASTLPELKAVPANVLAGLPTHPTFGAFWEWAQPLLFPTTLLHVPLALAISTLRTELARKSLAPNERPAG